MGALYSWMRIYDSRDAEEYVYRWKESIEMDMEHTVDDENDSGEEQTLSEYCAERGIHIPDVEESKPSCLRGDAKPCKGQRRSMSLLKQHRNGPFSEWIEPVLSIAAIRDMKWKPSNEVRLIIDDGYEDGPLPNWVVAFREHDAGAGCR